MSQISLSGNTHNNFNKEVVTSPAILFNLSVNARVSPPQRREILSLRDGRKCEKEKHVVRRERV
jgi:hypothetical protein